jgi:hypothetical protein
MLKRLAGTNPNWAVRIPIKHTTMLFRAANSQPCQIFFPINTVETTVRTQDT